MPEGERRWWFSRWKLNLPSKIKVFLWRCFHDLLFSKEILNSRGIYQNMGV